MPKPHLWKTIAKLILSKASCSLYPSSRVCGAFNLAITSWPASLREKARGFQPARQDVGELQKSTGVRALDRCIRLRHLRHEKMGNPTDCISKFLSVNPKDLGALPKNFACGPRK
eukprot:gene14255-5281_t